MANDEKEEREVEKQKDGTVEDSLNIEENYMKIEALFVVFNALLESDDDALCCDEQLFGLRFICRDVLKELRILNDCDYLRGKEGGVKDD